MGRKDRWCALRHVITLPNSLPRSTFISHLFRTGINRLESQARKFLGFSQNDLLCGKGKILFSEGSSRRETCSYMILFGLELSWKIYSSIFGTTLVAPSDSGDYIQGGWLFSDCFSCAMSFRRVYNVT